MRGRILAGATPYFARRGYDGVRIGGLACALGISPGTIYLYFPSKEALLREIFRPVREEVLPALHALLAPEGPAAGQVRRLSETLIARLEGRPEFAAQVVLADQIIHGAGRTAEAFRSGWAALCQETAALAERAQREGGGVPGCPEVLAQGYWGAVFLCARRRLFAPDAEIAQADYLTRLLLRDGAAPEDL